MMAQKEAFKQCPGPSRLRVCPTLRHGCRVAFCKPNTALVVIPCPAPVCIVHNSVVSCHAYVEWNRKHQGSQQIPGNRWHGTHLRRAGERLYLECWREAPLGMRSSHGNVAFAWCWILYKPTDMPKRTQTLNRRLSGSQIITTLAHGFVDMRGFLITAHTGPGLHSRIATRVQRDWPLEAPKCYLKLPSLNQNSLGSASSWNLKPQAPGSDSYSPQPF